MKKLILVYFAVIVMAHGNELVGNPVEVGSVQWGRDLDAALKTSEDSGRPVFLFFQEVPGCAGCQAFGRDVLTNPLLVEAIEDEFLPVLVYNNRRDGMDKMVLDRYGEPAWNFQVVRFLDARGRDIIPRKDRVWSLCGMASRMIEALKAADRPVPRYLDAVASEYNSENLGTNAFAMSCFWTGEMKLGQIDGVVATEAGWIEGREVTQVVYDKDKISLRELAVKARNVQCARKVYFSENEMTDLHGFSTGRLDSNYRKARASDQKKQMTGWHTILDLPGLTEMQKTKINAYIRSDRSKAMEWLSPRQSRALRTAE